MTDLRRLAEAAMTAERMWYQEKRGTPDHPLPTFVAYGAEQTAYHAACSPDVILALLNVVDAAQGVERECLTRRTLHDALDQLAAVIAAIDKAE
jgi:acyl carrier protein phosphodiesterase